MPRDMSKIAGSNPKTRVAVITPYFDEPLDIVRQCHKSVLDQTHSCEHFLICDGLERTEVLQWKAQHIRMNRPHADCGNTPRGIGSLAAMNEDFDAICYLDADNWYCPNHVEAMLSLQRQTGAEVCAGTRSVHGWDGELLFVDRDECDGVKHVDTSCLFLTRAAFGLLPIWAMMPRQLSPIGDFIFWDAVCNQGFTRAHHPEPTVAFRTRYAAHYVRVQRPAPPEAKTVAATSDAAMDWWKALPQDQKDHWWRFARTRLL
jgi:hypothetical protein